MLITFIVNSAIFLLRIALFYLFNIKSVHVVHKNTKEKKANEMKKKQKIHSNTKHKIQSVLYEH